MAWRRARPAAALILFLVAGASASATSQEDEPAANRVTHIRAGDSSLVSLIARARGRSPTFERLVDSVESSRVIVYIRRGPCSGPVEACLHFLSRDVEHAYVRVTLSIVHGDEAIRVGLLAHELQHALDIAAMPQVQDHASLAMVLQKTGWPNASGFELAGAAPIARVVEAEFARPRR